MVRRVLSRDFRLDKAYLVLVLVCCVYVWVGHCSLPLHLLKHSHYRSISQPQLHDNSSHMHEVLHFICSLHDIVTPTNLCMLVKITCWKYIRLINIAVNTSRRFPLALARLCKTWEDMCLSSSEVLDIGDCTKEGIYVCIPAMLEVLCFG